MKRVFKRRRRLLVTTMLFFVLLSVGSLYVIEPKYESSISILVEEGDTLNPLMMYEIAADGTSQDQLKSFNEIIYSRSTMIKLIDSLYLDKGVTSGVPKQALIDKLRKNIKTRSGASNALEITYVDTNPLRARDGVQLLANHVMQTRLRLENRRNNETVAFFQQKVDELENIVDNQRNEITNTTTEGIKETPVDQTSLQNQLQRIDSDLDQLEWKIIQEENILKRLNKFLKRDAQNFSIQPLYELPLGDLPLGGRLDELLGEYDQLKQRFKEDYPQLRSLRLRILEVTNRIPGAIQTRLTNLKIQRNNLSSQRVEIINDMEKVFIASQLKSNQQSNYAIYQKLYTDMKVKLEQARMRRDIGDKTSGQFVVLDPPYIPKKPTLPNKKLILAGGLLSGIIFGMIFMGVAEALDTTIRSDEDLEFSKPIIAYLSDGRA